MTYENPYMNGQIWPKLNILEILRQRNPLVICITNDVVRTFTANGLLAIGASPVMSECSEDLKRPHHPCIGATHQYWYSYTRQGYLLQRGHSTGEEI